MALNGLMCVVMCR